MDKKTGIRIGLDAAVCRLRGLGQTARDTAMQDFYAMAARIIATLSVEDAQATVSDAAGKE